MNRYEELKNVKRKLVHGIYCTTQSGKIHHGQSDGLLMSDETAEIICGFFGQFTWIDSPRLPDFLQSSLFYSMDKIF
jgi:hypothetical protein